MQDRLTFVDLQRSIVLPTRLGRRLVRPHADCLHPLLLPSPSRLPSQICAHSICGDLWGWLCLVWCRPGCQYPHRWTRALWRWRRRHSHWYSPSDGSGHPVRGSTHAVQPLRIGIRVVRCGFGKHDRLLIVFQCLDHWVRGHVSPLGVQLSQCHQTSHRRRPHGPRHLEVVLLHQLTHRASATVAVCHLLNPPRAAYPL